MKISIPARAHLVGIKGVAMASLAVYLKGQGVIVTGSDISDIFPTDTELKEAGITVYVGFDAVHVTASPRPDVVYFTGAHGGRDNVEVVAARESGIPVYPHGQGIGMLAGSSRQIVVAGCHGKTTTSAMTACLLEHAGTDPSYAIGCGGIPGMGAAGHYGKSPWIVIEGDEYATDPGHDQTPRFLWLRPEILVVTNIDFDHPDVYGSLSDVQTAFGLLAEKVISGGVSIVNADDENSAALLKRPNVITYGQSPVSQYRIERIALGQQRIFFRLSVQHTDIGEFVLHVPGVHNVYNAVSAMIAAHEAANIGWDSIRDGIAAFRGTARRFESLGEIRGVSFIDDYAHHPAEIETTLKAAKGWFGARRIIAVFQPHTYSRTKSLLTRFARAFGMADEVILTDIYASAREHDSLGIDGMTLVSEMSTVHSRVRYAKNPDEVASALRGLLRDGDVVLFMGAGDIYTWSRTIVTEYGNIPEHI